MKRRYFHLAEKETKDVSGMWKGLHATLLILTAISSAVGLNSFNDIYDIFNYRCVPYSKIKFVVQEIEYLNTSKVPQHVSTTEKDIGNVTQMPEEAKPQEFRPLEVEVEHEPVEVEYKKPKHGFVPKVRATFNHSSSNMTKIPGTPDTYIFENEIWLKNETLMGKVTINMMKTVFATVMTCDFVLFAAMMSIVTATSFAVIILMCSKGGKGRGGTGGVTQPYRYVYVLMICSISMVIFSGVANNIVNKGFHLFCYRCARFTGSPRCTHVMDYFTPQQKLGIRPFHRDWVITSNAHLITIWLWIAQLILVALRVISRADFQFRTIFIKKKISVDVEEEDDEDDKQLRHALRRKIPDLSRGEIILDEKDLDGLKPDEATQV